VALWFLIIDSIQAVALHADGLGAALFHRGAAPWLDAVPNFEMVLMFTWVHGLAFIVIGGIVARLLAIAERQPNAGFGILMLFVLFEFGFIAAAMLLAAPCCRRSRGRRSSWPTCWRRRRWAATSGCDTRI